MSHSSAEFHFADGITLYGEYNDTVDVMCTRIFATPEERDDAWRKQVWTRCTCGKPHEPCVAVITLGEPSGWLGTSCRSCMLFTGPHSPYDVDNFEGQAGLDAAISRLTSPESAPRP